MAEKTGGWGLAQGFAKVGSVFGVGGKKEKEPSDGEDKRAETDKKATKTFKEKRPKLPTKAKGHDTGSSSSKGTKDTDTQDFFNESTLPRRLISGLEQVILDLHSENADLSTIQSTLEKILSRYRPKSETYKSKHSGEDDPYDTYNGFTKEILEAAETLNTAISSNKQVSESFEALQKAMRAPTVFFQQLQETSDHGEIVQAIQALLSNAPTKKENPVVAKAIRCLNKKDFPFSYKETILISKAISFVYNETISKKRGTLPTLLVALQKLLNEPPAKQLLKQTLGLLEQLQEEDIADRKRKLNELRICLNYLIENDLIQNPLFQKFPFFDLRPPTLLTLREQLTKRNHTKLNKSLKSAHSFLTSSLKQASEAASEEEILDIEPQTPSGTKLPWIGKSLEELAYDGGKGGLKYAHNNQLEVGDVLKRIGNIAVLGTPNSHLVNLKHHVDGLLNSENPEEYAKHKGEFIGLVKRFKHKFTNPPFDALLTPKQIRRIIDLSSALEKNNQEKYDSLIPKVHKYLEEAITKNQGILESVLAKFLHISDVKNKASPVGPLIDGVIDKLVEKIKQKDGVNDTLKHLVVGKAHPALIAALKCIRTLKKAVHIQAQILEEDSNVKGHTENHRKKKQEAIQAIERAIEEADEIFEAIKDHSESIFKPNSDSEKVSEKIAPGKNKGKAKVSDTSETESQHPASEESVAFTSDRAEQFAKLFRDFGNMGDDEGYVDFTDKSQKEDLLETFKGLHDVISEEFRDQAGVLSIAAETIAEEVGQYLEDGERIIDKTNQGLDKVTTVLAETVPNLLKQVQKLVKNKHFKPLAKSVNTLSKVAERLCPEKKRAKKTPLYRKKKS